MELRNKKNPQMLILSLFMVAALAALAGCSDDSSPTAPPPEPEPTMALITKVTVTKFECIKDGDGIEGAGEFRFFAKINSSDKNWERTLSSGESSVLDWTGGAYDNNYTGTGQNLEVKFGCTEMDMTVLGKEYPDSDMNERRGTAKYVTSPDLAETNYITLGNDNCKVRLHYRITSELVEI